MNIWYLLQAPAWIIVFVTACARFDDIKKCDRSLFWHSRRLSLMLSATVATIMVMTPFTESRYLLPENSWRGLMIGWAWAGTWLTTPNHKPWFEWLTGKPVDRRIIEKRFIGRITGQFPAIGGRRKGDTK